MEIKLSDWCRQKYEEATEADNTKEANNYMELYSLWLNRGM